MRGYDPLDKLLNGIIYTGLFVSMLMLVLLIVAIVVVVA